MLVFSDVSKYYGKKKGIEEISFQLEEGSVMALLGNNGSGKTTTFRLLLGLLSPDSGLIEAPYEKRIEYGYLPEERSLLKELTVFNQVAFLARLKKMRKEEIEFSYQRWETKLRIKAYRQKRIRELSKGNQQKVQLLCSIIHNPKVVILDEPFTGLDQENILLFKRVIQQLKAEKKIILLSSHQHDHIEDFCDKLLILKEGEMRYFGDIETLKKRYGNRYITLKTADYKKMKSAKLIEYQLLGKKIKLLFENEKFSRIYAAYQLHHEKVNFLKYEEISLTDAIKELMVDG